MDAGAGRTEPCLLTISREEQHLDVPGLLIQIFHFHLHFLMFPLDLIDSFVDFFTSHHAVNFLLSLSLKRYISSHTVCSELELLSVAQSVTCLCETAMSSH